MRIRREIPIVVKKSGEKFIPTFPVTLEPGDEFIVAREETGVQVPEKQSWTINGYTSSGPIVTKGGK